MARDVQTTATLQARTKGFVEASQQAAKINKAASAAAKDQLRNTKEVEKELGRMGSRLKDLARLQVSLNREMDKVDKASDLYKKLAGRMSEVNKQQSDLQRAASNVERAFKSQEKAVTAAQMARGGFAQGLLQGAAPGTATFLQRGPGMARQAVGMGLGRSVRGVVGGLAGSPFSGLSGIGQALSAIPGGGLVGGPMMLAAQQAGPALAFRQSMQQLMPYLGTAGMQAQFSRVNAKLSKAKIARLARKRATTQTGYEERFIYQGDQQIGYEEVFEETTDEQLRRSEEKRLRAKRARMLGSATATKRMLSATIVAPGVEQAAMAKPEAMQFAAQVAQVSGGRVVEMVRRSPEFFKTAFAAKTLYGAGPEVAGAFMQAERRGGLVGGAGRGSEALAEAIGQATAIGLEGSEVNDFLGVIASGIQDWKRTGIHMNAGSITGIARGVGESIGAVRGLAVARGMQTAATGAAMKGPQTNLDLMMMQAAGYRGGGAAEFEQAQIALEKGLSSEQWNTILERLIQQGGGGSTGRLYAREQFQRAGITMPGSEMQKLAREGIAGVPGAEQLTDAQLAEQAAAATDPLARRQAAITNKQIASGDLMIKSTQDMEEAASNIATAFSEELGPKLAELTGQIKELTKSLGPAIEKLKKLSSGEMGLLEAFATGDGG